MTPTFEHRGWHYIWQGYSGSYKKVRPMTLSDAEKRHIQRMENSIAAETETLAKRLREQFEPGGDIYAAADELDRLRARIAELEAENQKLRDDLTREQGGRLSDNWKSAHEIAELEAEVERLKDQLREPCNDAEFGMKP